MITRTPFLRDFKLRILRQIFRRYMLWQLPELTYPQYILALDHPIDPKPRYGYDRPPHDKLHAIINRDRCGFKTFISDLRWILDDIRSIAELNGKLGCEPTFHNPFFTGLDAIVLYHMIASRKPRRFVEVGSGFSTRFARRAVRDHSPATQITSCDPQPRSEIDGLCDVVIREPLEVIGTELVQGLEPGDILFVDSSHRCYCNSDVCVLFLEILPDLPAGSIIHFHDIFLPYDYPPIWIKRYYTEQYLLACFLLANPNQFRCIFPGAFVWRDDDLRRDLDWIWTRAPLQHIYTQMDKIYLGYGSFSFWFELTGDGSRNNDQGSGRGSQGSDDG